VIDPALLSAQACEGTRLQDRSRRPHGMCSRLKDQINAELLAFFHQAERKEGAWKRYI